MKRLFFGFEIAAPWPDTLPKGKLLDEEHRHMTLAFLGNVSFEPIEDKLDGIPKISLGMAGIFDELLFLPVVAWHGKTLGKEDRIASYQKELADYLNHKEERPFLPHVTLARKPYDKEGWEKAFHPLPFIVKGLHLYESLGGLKYEPIWSQLCVPPFEEFEHVADIAFHIHGITYDELFLNAQIALAFKFPNMIHYFSEKPVSSTDEIITALGEIVTKADQEEGCPFKAVSYHGKLTTSENEIMDWEMIVDV